MEPRRPARFVELLAIMTAQQSTPTLHSDLRFTGPKGQPRASRCVWCNRKLEGSGPLHESSYCGHACRDESIRALLRRERHKAARFDSILRAAERVRLEGEAAQLRTMFPRFDTQQQRQVA